MTVDIAGCTHIGLLRRENQDGFLADRFLGPGGEPIVCLAVADGMGGHQEGRRASFEAIQALKDSLSDLVQKNSGDLSEGWAVGIEESAHAKVGKIAGGDEIVGTTLTIALIKDRDCVIGHVGDTRAYRYRGGKLEQLTADHTWEAFFRAQQAENPYGRALRQAIGVGEKIETETHCITLQEEDWVLLCSDGLYKMVPDTAIEKALDGAATAAGACDRLLKLALKAGGRDNVAICVSRTGQPKEESWLNRIFSSRKE